MLADRKEAAINIVKNIKSIRIKRGLNKIELSKKAGLAKEYISQLEIHNYMPSLFAAYNLCEVLNCKIEDLFK